MMRIVVCVKEVLDPAAVNNYALSGGLKMSADGRHPDVAADHHRPGARVPLGPLRGRTSTVRARGHADTIIRTGKALAIR